MSSDRRLHYRLYEKLLALYPRAFRDKFGESMAHTFIDLCRERERQAGSAYAGYVAWLMIETTFGAVKENVVVMKEGSIMNVLGANVRSAALVSTVLVLPLLALELTLGRANGGGIRDRVVLFGTLWLVAAGFLLILSSTLRTLREPGRASARRLLLGAVGLGLLGFFWGGLVLDQFPCFMGVPNCD